MEIPKEKLRELLLWLVDLLYQARGELIAYQVAHTLLHAAGAGLGRELDLVLAESRRNPSPALLADHQKLRDTIERLLREEKVDEALTFLKNWKPTGSTH